MVELEPKAFKKVLPLYLAQEQNRFPLILAVIRNKQQGRVFVDDFAQPLSAMVITKFGFMQVFGAEAAEGFDREIADFFAAKPPRIASYLLWYAPPQRWQKKLEALEGRLVRRRERVRFLLQKKAFDLGQDAPRGHQLRLLDEDCLRKTGDFHLEISSRFWSSADDFLKNGIGVCLVQDDKIASLCYAACVVDGLAEVDIITRSESQGRGLATIVGQYFIQECLRRNIAPTWDCFLNNAASMNLAEKLGFSESQHYLFYTLNLPGVFQADEKRMR